MVRMASTTQLYGAAPYGGYGTGGYGAGGYGGAYPHAGMGMGMGGMGMGAGTGAGMGTVSPSVPGGIPASPSTGMPPGIPSGAYVTPNGGNVVTVQATEESYIENILRLNRGKVATVYMTFENNSQWNAKIFRGVIEAAGRDHLILSDPATGMRYLLLMVNLDYVTFDEPINYSPQFQGTGAGTAVPSR